MGIFGAMLTAVSGLRAQSYALENISGNIANSQTTGFKRVETSFIDLIPDAPFKHEVAGSVSATSRLTNTIQGDLQATGVPTHMALNGQGYFVVQERAGYNNNKPIFGGSDLYTRRGDFTLDKDGYLVNGAGYYLKGSSIDPASGEVRGAGNGVIQISSDPIKAHQTTEIVYKANLPSSPATASASATVPDSELLNQKDFKTDPTSTDSKPTPGTGTVTKQDQSLFMSRSISGGNITVYNAVGAPIDVQLRWAKVANGDAAATPPTDDTWNLFYLKDSNPAKDTDVAWQNVNASMSFDATGKMTAPPAPYTIPITDLTTDGNTIPGTIKLNFGITGITQYASAGGVVQASTIQQDGYSSGSLDSVSVTSDGRISGNYSNGRVMAVAALSIAQFNADNSLKRRDGGVYEQTLESGLPIIGLNGASIIGGNVENSNTDIAEEFSKMIVTQQAYSANTRVVSTSQQMLTEVINMVR